MHKSLSHSHLSVMLCLRGRYNNTIITHSTDKPTKFSRFLSWLYEEKSRYGKKAPLNSLYGTCNPTIDIWDLSTTHDDSLRVRPWYKGITLGCENMKKQRNQERSSLIYSMKLNSIPGEPHVEYFRWLPYVLRKTVFFSCENIRVKVNCNDEWLPFTSIYSWRTIL